MTRAEAISAALLAALQPVAVAPAGPKLRRGGGVTEEIDGAGLIDIVDGAAEDIEELLGGAREMMVVHELEIAVALADDASRAAALDGIAGACAAAVLADAELARLADHIRIHPLRDRQEIAVKGAAAIRTATLPIEIHFTTLRNPFGDG